MAERDYYEVLGIPRDATADQIKQAYRKLAKKYHPDRNPNDKSAEGRFKEVQAAYDVLSEPEKRKTYDRFGHAGTGGPAGPGAGWRSGPSGDRVYTWRSGGGPDIPIEDLDDLFSAFGNRGAGQAAGGESVFDQFFRQRGSRRGGRRGTAAPPPAGQDVELPVNLTFEQAVSGTQLDLTLPDSERRVTVRIPPGIADAQRIRVRGQGPPAVPGGPPGDIYIVAHVQPHRYFRRLGNDVYLDLPLTVSEAALGTRVEIPTLGGRTTLTVPPGTPSGARLRLRGKGVAQGNKTPGDQYAVIRIVPPKTLTPRQRELFEELRTLGEDDPRGALGW